jgi:DHA1 family bicyclomycin/chloramphenicol resistance-like MFS transporter/DHA1 family 2-module integral membrane pump EmrD-like MFS transporter
MTWVVAGAPFFGGYLETYANWRFSFGLLIFYTLVVGLLIRFILRETNLHHDKSRLDLAFIYQSFLKVLRSPIFMGYALCVFLVYGAFFSWFTIGPVLLVKYCGLSATEFGSFNLILGGSAMTAGSLFNGKMVRKLGQAGMLTLGLSLIMSSGISLFFCQYLYGASAFAILACIFIFLFGVTLVWPNAFAGAFEPFGSIAGYASGLYSCMQLGGGAVVSWLSTLLPTNSPYTLPSVFILSSLTAWLTLQLLVKKARTS